MNSGRVEVEASEPAAATVVPDPGAAMGNTRETGQDRQLSGGNERQKRSYQFLMGLINNNSRFETTTDSDGRTNAVPDANIQAKAGDMAASEALLELLIKISSRPGQWERVHQLLHKIDDDLVASKKLYKSIQGTSGGEMSEQAAVDKKDGSNKLETGEVVALTMEREEIVPQQYRTLPDTKAETSDEGEIQKMVVVLGGKGKQTKSTRNKTDEDATALKTNEWPDFDRSQQGRVVYKTASRPAHGHFAYHRVTGQPLYHSGGSPKAYIAVSVIAPKPLQPSSSRDEDLILENELRQLKPWTHKQNLRNMAAMRSRWVIESPQGRADAPP